MIEALLQDWACLLGVKSSFSLVVSETQFFACSDRYLLDISTVKG
jgi:hypothetical protein